MRATWAEHGQSRCAKRGVIRAMAKLAEMRNLGVYGRERLVLSGYPLHGDRLLRWPWMRQVGLHGKCSYVARANRGMASKWIERGEVRREPRSDCASGVELGGEVS